MLHSKLLPLRCFPYSSLGASGIHSRRRKYPLIDVHQAKPFEKIPHLPMLPLVGSSWAYWPIIGRYDPERHHLSLADKQKMFGNIVRERLGTSDLVTTFNADDARKIFVLETQRVVPPYRVELESLKKYRQSGEAMRYLKKTSLLIMQGKEWKELRGKVWIEIEKCAERYSEEIFDIAQEFARKVYENEALKMESSDFMQEVHKWALETVTYVTLDRRLGLLSKNLGENDDAFKLIKAVKSQLSLMGKLEAAFGSFQLWRVFPTPTWRKFEKVAAEVIRISSNFIGEALDELKEKQGDKVTPEEIKERREKGEKVTLLEVLLVQKQLEESEVFSVCTDLLMAGIDTVSNAVGYVLYHLSKNPEKQEKLYEEVMQFLPTSDDKVTKENIKQLQYANACITEALRLHPVNIITARVMTEDVVLSGYLVPKGTMVGFGLYCMLRNEKYFKHASSYCPERFVERWKDDRFPTMSLFGAGIRSCIARRFAEREIACLIISIIRRFRVESTCENLGMVTKISTSPDKPLLFKFYNRELKNGR